MGRGEVKLLPLPLVTKCDRYRFATCSFASRYCVEGRSADACDGARGTDFETTCAEGQYGNADTKQELFQQSTIMIHQPKHMLRRSGVNSAAVLTCYMSRLELMSMIFII